MWTSLKRWLLKWAFYPLFRRYVSMPGRSFTGKMPPLTELEKRVATNLRLHVDELAVKIGIRHAHSGDSLKRSADYILTQFIQRGRSVVMEPFHVDGIVQHNVIADIPGRKRPDKIVVIGAHYDTVPGSPGADDNASGVAALIELAELLKSMELDCTVRLAAFFNEEENDHWMEMGSYYHARSSHERGDDIVGMISLEMLGYFSNEPGSQKYPFPFNLYYPDAGNFIGFVGNDASRDWVRKVIGEFRKVATFASEGAAPPERYQDIARSDHWAYWQFGWPALMVTDTSNFRFPYLHGMDDTPDKCDFDSMARITVAMAKVIERLARV
ncbi:MAG: M20/M25/M40 family metallo-hydrolase [Candidatus Obscuribacterales bacterium]|nr:M20/M25/M40 family metallo-hydrolase [Candidatus Obscuribacterales bacterium]